MKNKKNLIKSLLFCILWLVPFIVIGTLAEKVENDILQDTIKLISRIVASAGIFIYVKKLYGIGPDLRKNNLVKGIFWYGSVIFLFTCLMFVLNYKTPEIAFIKAMPLLIFYLIANLAVGLFEEALCRGLLFNTFKEYWGDNKKGVYLGALISSLLFGSLHLFNLNGYNTVSTITQVIYATFFGMLFATVYYRSGNLLSCVILHGLVDYASSFWKCFLADRAAQTAIEEVTDSTISEALIVLAITSLFVISSLIQLKKEFKTRNNEGK